jgi:hypothetical protein
MKITIDISDALLERAKRLARGRGVPLRAVIEDGLRRVLEERPAEKCYELPDLSVGSLDAANPVESLTWPELRDAIYGVR